jgi:hypothetical protein
MISGYECPLMPKVFDVVRGSCCDGEVGIAKVIRSAVVDDPLVGSYAGQWCEQGR